MPCCNMRVAQPPGASGTGSGTVRADREQNASAQPVSMVVGSDCACRGWSAGPHPEPALQARRVHVVVHVVKGAQRVVALGPGGHSTSIACGRLVLLHFSLSQPCFAAFHRAPYSGTDCYRVSGPLAHNRGCRRPQAACMQSGPCSARTRRSPRRWKRVLTCQPRPHSPPCCWAHSR